MTNTFELTFDVLDADAWQFALKADQESTIEAAELYARHIEMLDDYLNDRRVLN